MRFVKVVISTAIVLLGIAFIIENLEMLKTAVKIKLDLYVVYLESPDIHLWVIILFCVFLGVFTASLYGVYEILMQRKTIRQLRHNLEILAQELKQAGAAAPPASFPESPARPPSE
jgi:ABC-type enterochelin transport system permease subunit